MAGVLSFKDKTKLLFGAHGRFCASHPWEVIVTTVTLTVCVLSMSVLSGGKVATPCGVNKPCEKDVEENTVLLSVVNCLAVIYIYNQFSSLRKAGSKYLLGIAGLFTVFSSFVFGSAAVNLIDTRASGLSEALPFFLLLIDLSKASALAKFAFWSRNGEEVRQNISRGMAAMGPTMTLDTLVEALLVGIGTISGVRQLEVICWFGCISILTNYIVFMTFFPSALALVLEVCPSDPENSSWHLDQLAREMQEEEKQPNPVVQRVKIIMALGLAVMHLHSWFFSQLIGLSLGGLPPSFEDNEGVSGVGGLSEETAEGEEGGGGGGGGREKVSMMEFLWLKVFHLSGDQIITLVLTIILFIKYIFFDKSLTFSSSSVPPTPTHSQRNSVFSLKPFPSQKLKEDLPRLKMDPYFMRHSPPLVAQQQQQQGSIQLPDAAAAVAAMSHSGDEVTACPFASVGGVGEQRVGAVSSTQGMLMDQPHQLPSVSCQATQTDPPQDLEEGLASLASAVENKTSVFTVGADESSSPSPVSSPPRSPSPAPPPPSSSSSSGPRQLEECLAIFKSDAGPSALTNEEVLLLVEGKHIPAYKLESALGDLERGVSVRRALISQKLGSPQENDKMEGLPFSGYDYSPVQGACCENVVGYMPLPVGVAGPLLVDGEPFYVPMATTEGCLVASTNRGCRAVASSGGVRTAVNGDGMTRGPVVRMPSASEASSVKLWLDDGEGQSLSMIAEAFSSTSRFIRLKGVHSAVAGKHVFIRFKATTGDAMGMNMLSKGVEKALGVIQSRFPAMEIVSLSGNFCTDKKPAAINWVEGRGKSVVCEATVPVQVVQQVLKTSVDALVELNISKNLVGSAMAGSVGGFNAHAANIVTAIFIATGQDPAQNIASSNCITLLEHCGPQGKDLHISCTMPSIEIGTVGGGTVLAPQSACLKMLGVQGPNRDNPGENATKLARIVCATVLAGELSLLSALAAGHLVKSHMRHNRSQLNLVPISEAPHDKKEPSSPSADS